MMRRSVTSITVMVRVNPNVRTLKVKHTGKTNRKKCDSNDMSLAAQSGFIFLKTKCFDAHRNFMTELSLRLV